ncbi:hypothetical protein [Frankia sp. AgW1.1]|uniref:hypothetical protein n=1 Tax=Frankia sp. AgW1.1 TaxID=1836971 RepID=UPI0019315F2A|nr:hypothetical protein [Frankia sp. AgW1.1]MBL7487136.1 hypothetical protein [Frankia sp. AgW1.1]
MIVHHPASDCTADACPFHWPSDHLMVFWPMVWRGDRGLIERLCPHKIGHPDPDSLAWLAARGIDDPGVHGCDGCCSANRREAS